MGEIHSAVVIGSGNVAESVAVAIAGCEALELRQVVARNAARAEAVALLAGCSYGDMEHISDADIYIISVSDRAVAEVAEQLRQSVGAQALVVHTAGSIEMDALGEGERGVFYPFQTFTAGRRVDFSRVPLFVEGCDEPTTQAIEAFARKLSQRVYRATSQRRREVHLTGVLSCNFVNALYAMAADRLAEREALPFDVLRELILETARKASEAEHPRMVQTGPAVRGDKAVAERHMAMFDDEAQKQIYKLLNDYIWQTSKKI